MVDTDHILESKGSVRCYDDNAILEGIRFVLRDANYV